MTNLIFIIALFGGFFVARLIQKRKVTVDELLVLTWQSFALSLTFRYLIGTFDFLFFKPSHFGFSVNDIVTIAVPGLICLAILAISVYYEYISKPSHRGKK